MDFDVKFTLRKHYVQRYVHTWYRACLRGSQKLWTSIRYVLRVPLSLFPLALVITIKLKRVAILF